MKKNILLLIFCIIGLAMPGNANAQSLSSYERDVIETSSGKLEIFFIGHGTLVFRYESKIIHVDPVFREGDYTVMPDADLILVTHHHGDHLDENAVDEIRKENTDLLCPRKSYEMLQDKTGALVMENGDERIWESLTIEAVPAYNIQHKRSSGEPYHIKGEGNGYVVSFGKTRVYIAGDTENIPEMKELKKIDLAFLPMNLPYTMSPEMAADAARSFLPRILYPYHYGDTDPGKLRKLLADEDRIEIRIRAMQ